MSQRKYVTGSAIIKTSHPLRDYVNLMSTKICQDKQKPAFLSLSLISHTCIYCWQGEIFINKTFVKIKIKNWDFFLVGAIIAH